MANDGASAEESVEVDVNICRTRDVLPAPRKPVTMSTGSGAPAADDDCAVAGGTDTVGSGVWTSLRESVAQISSESVKQWLLALVERS